MKMNRKMLFCFLLLVAGFLISCATIPKEMVEENENLTVDVEISLHDDLLFTDAGFLKVKIEMPSSLRTDLTAQQIINVFQKEFFEALKERNINIIPGAPIKLQMGIARGSNRAGLVSRASYLAAGMRLMKGNESLANRFITVSSFELYGMFTTEYERLAKKLAEASANDIAVQLKEIKAGKEGEK